MSPLRMPAGWAGVQRSAEEWVRWALYDASGSLLSVDLADSLIAITTLEQVPVEDLITWIYAARPDERTCERWRKLAPAIAELRRGLAARQAEQKANADR